MTAPGLPPMTESQAIDFYRKAKGVGANIITMTSTRDYREWMTTALAVIVHLGDRLVDLSTLALEQQEVQQALETQLRSYVQRNLEAPVPDEKFDCQLCGRSRSVTAKSKGFGYYCDDCWRDRHEDITGVPLDEEITGVAWQGTSADYFDNFAEINHELAQNISQAARAATKREEAMKLHPAALDAESRPSEDPES